MSFRNSFILALTLSLGASPTLSGQSNMLMFNAEDVDNFRIVFMDDYYYGNKKLDDASILVRYDMTIVYDTLAHKSITAKDLLQVGPRWAKYQEEVKYQYDARMKDKASDGVIFLSDRDKDRVYWAGFYDTYLLDRTNKKISFACRMAAEDFKIEESAPEIDWQLMSDSKQIGPYVCQHAVARVGGRNWHAWFAPDVPVSVGPWKLHGLPGLIVSAYDDDRQYVFEATSVLEEKSPIYLIDYPYTKISRKQYNKMFKEMMEFYFHFVNSHLTGSGVRYIPDTNEKRTTMSYSLIERDEE